MKKILFSLCIFFLSISLAMAEERVEVTLSACVDGDTATFILNGEKQKFRFLAIDTPESVHPTKEVQAYGKDASEYTCNRLKNAKKIEIEYDTKSGKTDKYGRNLGWIWVDNRLLQDDLISIGYAQVSYVYSKYKYVESLCYTQSKAREEKKGIWTDKTREIGYCEKVDYTSATSVNEGKALVNVSSKLSDFYYYIIYGILGIGVMAGFISKTTAKKIAKSIKR